MTSFCHGEIRMQWVIPPLEVFKGAQDSPSMRAEIWDGFIQNKINKEYPCIEVGFKSKPIFPNFLISNPPTHSSQGLMDKPELWLIQKFQFCSVLSQISDSLFLLSPAIEVPVSSAKM